jgi:hypothetical protein
MDGRPISRTLGKVLGPWDLSGTTNGVCFTGRRYCQTDRDLEIWIAVSLAKVCFASADPHVGFGLIYGQSKKKSRIETMSRVERTIFNVHSAENKLFRVTLIFRDEVFFPTSTVILHTNLPIICLKLNYKGGFLRA